MSFYRIRVSVLVVYISLGSLLLFGLDKLNISKGMDDKNKSGLDLLKDLGKNKKIAHTLIGEAVGEGIEGMQIVYDVMRNQSVFFGQSLQDVVKSKYSAYRRFDLSNFVSKQPKKLVDAAYNIVTANAPDSTGGALHFENIEEYGIPKYVKQEGGLIPLKFVRNHTLFVTLREYLILRDRGKLSAGLEVNLITNKEQLKNARIANTTTGTVASATIPSIPR